MTSLIEDKLKNFNSKSNTTNVALNINNQINKKSQNVTKIALNLADPNSLTSQIKIAPTQIGRNNANNRTQTEVDKKETAPHRTTEIWSADMKHEANVDVNDVSAILPFKSLPAAQQLHQEYTSTAIKEPPKSETNNELQLTDTGTTVRPMASATTMSAIKIITTTAAKRPAATTAINVNRNKTIGIATTTPATTTTITKEVKQKPTKINKSSSSNDSEIKISSSSSTTATTSSSSTSSVGTVSTFKTKSNITRRIASSKPIKHHKPTANSMLPTATIKSAPKTNAIHFDRTSATTRRTTRPTTKANSPHHFVSQRKAESAVATKTTITTTKPAAATTNTLLSTSTAKPSTPSSSASSSPLQRAPNTNPVFMSPFDKLPFMDASFEVKRNSATPPTTKAYSQQHFAVAATIATDALLDGANDKPDSHDNVNADVSDSFISSRHKLMGLVHYKHTLNQLEGLEPSRRQRPQQHSPPTNHLSSNANFGSTSVATQHQQPASSINNLIDPTGILKLAGCNIYGRMYRVGRIILELSSPCLECKCTEIGVKCGPLDC